ncbi:MAG: glutathionylspermidine synthase family protein [Burkholderiales bacterium]
METMGFSFHSADGGYWDETVCYQFSAAQIDELEAAAAELHRLALAAVEHVIKTRRYGDMRVSPNIIPLIEQSWARKEPTLYGRFDLAYDGEHPPKLLEYNADTPTSVLEAAVAQWQWLEDTGRADQFNSLHEKLIDQWRHMATQWSMGTTVFFSCIKDNDEDRVSVDYLRDTAMQAGLRTEFVYMEDLGWDGVSFVDLEERPVSTWFKLYPWEWLANETFGAHLMDSGLRFIEPPWKALLSNKAILAILWELNPGHPNLLPAYFEPLPASERQVAKPFYSREGANIRAKGPGLNHWTSGPYGAEGLVHQQWTPLPEFDGRYPVIGAWIVGDQPAGIGIREDAGQITTNSSRFIPHFFEPNSVEPTPGRTID